MAKTIRFLIFFSLAHLLIAQSAMAQVPSLPEAAGVVEEETMALEKEFRLRAEFISVMIQAGEDIDRNVKVDKAIFDQPEKMMTLLQEKILVYHRFYEEALQIPTEKKEIFKKGFQSLNWEKISAIFKKTHIGVEIFFKRKGFGLGIAIMAGFLCEYLVPAILIHIGLAHLIPLSMMTPWSTVYSFVPGGIQKTKIRKMLNEALGGKAQVEAYLEQEDMLLKHLHMQSPDDIIFPINESEGLTRSVVIQKENWLSGLMHRLGLKEGSLSYGSIQKFLSKNNISDPYVTWLTENETIDRNMKAGLIAGHLLSLKDQTIEDNFQKAFSEKIFYLRADGEWKDAWNWTKEMKKVKTLDELSKKIGEIPPTIHPKEIANIWESLLLPEYAVNFDLSFVEAKSMFDQFEVLKAKLNTSESSVLDEKTKNEIYIYLRKIIAGKKFKGCQNTPAKINQFLLGKTH